MAKSSNQKLKIPYVLQYLERNTDENHHVTVNDIKADLEKNGVTAERKSLYDDVAILQQLGYDIIQEHGRDGGYYMASRKFELAELKLLVDAVQSCKFISQKKTEDLIKKLEQETSRFHEVQLQRQVYNTNRVKTINEGVLYTIDNIHEAISNNRRISFHYCEWNMKKELVFKNNGKVYEVDPVALIWDDENYYLVAYDSDSSKKQSEYTEDDIRHYRVDKIRDLEILNDRRICTVAIGNFRPAEYLKEHFGMFSGKAEQVKLAFDEKLVGAMIDRFGKDITILPVEQNEPAARVRVQVSDQFYGWVSGFAGSIRILGPDSVVEGYKEFLDKIRERY